MVSGRSKHRSSLAVLFQVQSRVYHNARSVHLACTDVKSSILSAKFYNRHDDDKLSQTASKQTICRRSPDKDRFLRQQLVLSIFETPLIISTRWIIQ